MSFIVLDTDVSSTSLRGRLADPLRSRLAGHSLCISFVTLGELTKWTVLRAVATKWGELQAKAQLRGRPRPVNDTWIAACCLVHDVPLATFNTKDFEDFAEHDGLSLIGTEPQ